MSVSIQDFGKSTSGQTVRLATLKNDFIEVQLLSYAAIIHRIIVKDRKGNPVDVVLGYDTAADYELNTDSMGAAVGRFANRIAGAQFPLYEEIVHVTPNQNGNCLHSGLHGFNTARGREQAKKAIAVIGDWESVMGFRALGLDTYPVTSVEEARKTVHDLAKTDCAVIYLTETLAKDMADVLDRYKDNIQPAIILIPGREGSLGIGKSNIQSSIERAVGADIL